MTSAPLTYDLSLLTRSAERWRTAPGLRCYYRDLLQDVLGRRTSGPTLELWSGIGAIREIDADVITSDVAATPYVERVVSAYAIEEAGRLWGAIVAVDVLHHLCEPLRFLRSAAESLVDGGRIVLAEPAATLGGRWFYRWCHHEPCRPDELSAPWVFEGSGDSGEFANMGMGWALFVRDRVATEARLREFGLRLVDVRFRDGLGYPSTGGFSRGQLLPTALIRGVIRVERWLPQWLWRGMGLRMIITIEKGAAA